MSQYISSDNDAAFSTQHRLGRFFSAAILALLTVALHEVRAQEPAAPLQSSWLPHEATALIQVHSEQPVITAPHDDRSDGYDRFIQTQMVLLRCPMVIDRALEDSSVAKLPIVLAQRNKRAWLMQNLHVDQVGKSEIVEISFNANVDEAAAIVDAVVESYLTYIDEITDNTDKKLLQNLQLERRRHQLTAMSLQDSIRNALKENVAHEISLVKDETLLQDIVAAEITLIKMKAASKATKEQTSHDEIDQEIRAQEILAAELRAAYAEQRLIGAKVTAEVSFLQTQLDRTNRMIDRIDARILEVQGEARAPGRVILLSKATR